MDPDAAAQNDVTSLHLACRAGHEEVVRLLLEAGANAAATTHKNCTALGMAAEGGHARVVEVLLTWGLGSGVHPDGGADDDAGGGGGVSLELRAGAYEPAARSTLDAGDAYGCKPLLLAAACGSVETVLVLLKHGAKVDGRDNNDRTALIRCAYDGFVKVGLTLIEASADVNAFDKIGNTALISASGYGHKGTVTALLQAGADIDGIRVGDQRTPLIRACLYGHYATAHELLAHGAARDPRDVDGRTAGDILLEEVSRARTAAADTGRGYKDGPDDEGDEARLALFRELGLPNALDRVGKAQGWKQS
tara:strand:+ start:340 stop:1260 length:921 start_codon:yes stop_codon:yes gene_type:complete